MPFDKNSGLVFREEIVSGRGCDHRVEHKGNYKKYMSRQRRPERGTNTLTRTAINVLVDNASGLELESIETLPKHMVEMLWDCIREAGTNSLHAWQVFARTGHFGRTFVKRFDTKCIVCSKRLLGLRIPRGQHNNTLNWLTTLTLSGLPYGIGDLVDIANLDGLRDLYIQSGVHGPRPRESPFSDRTLQAWAIKASDHGALSNLETIFVDQQDGVTMRSLQYLNDFPDLRLFCVKDCGLNYSRHGKPTTPGWRLEGMGQKGPLYHFVEQQYGLPYSENIYWPDTVHRFLRHRNRGPSEENLPTLNMQIRESIRGGKRSQGDTMSFHELKTEVICFVRDQSLQSTPEASHEARSTSKRRKLNNKKAATFDHLLDGIT